MPDLEVLPKTYRGPVPEWPLEPPASEREAQLWDEMWRNPQAVVWVHYQLRRQVGMHVRTLVEIESGRQGSAMRRVAHSQAVSLLLTPTSLRRAGYRISPVEPLG
ncbi:hypothetical protein [Microbacterium arborescens]|uniref:hypothetical protein n=1 Tax=Microbacterium arborescens TaxID=33883 RepID=UPI0027837F70|nr:hypothetical protein [Microbacterium arborescens]MDQ1217991.1 hypothetical protein [Microbacterium arborescens]